jgi:ketosteroid isomerase-like protein
MGEAFRAAAPDNRLEARHTWEDGDTVIVEGVYSGTQTGPLAGSDGVIPATGRSFSLPYVDIFGARDGKIVSHRVYWDNAALLAQLGVLPVPVS